jgi:hypothetical protein
MLAAAFLEPGIDGEVVAEVNGRPALVIQEREGWREAWLAGRPLYGYVRPGDHGSVRTPTGGTALLRNILLWLAADRPVAHLWPYPPENAYRDIRPWDRRDVPTMELFPMVGECSLVCLLFNYLGLAYRTNLVMRVPEDARSITLVNVSTGEDLLPMARVRDAEVWLPIEMAAGSEYLAVELGWE